MGFVESVDDVGTRSQPNPPVGVLLLDAELRVVHHTVEAATILGYPRKPQERVSVARVLPAIRSQLTSPPKTPLLEFMSGRRRYHCRAFLLNAERRSSPAAGDRFQPTIVAVLERALPASRDLTEWFEAFQLTTWCDTFQLTNRESETVKLLLKGLTSKEIADQMRISPSTVKSFLKLVMVKVGASSRTGIVARILEKSS